MDNRSETALTIRGKTPAIYNKTSQVTAIQKAEAGATDYMPHISAGQVKLMAVVVNQNSRPEKVAG